MKFRPQSNKYVTVSEPVDQTQQQPSFDLSPSLQINDADVNSTAHRQRLMHAIPHHLFDKSNASALQLKIDQSVNVLPPMRPSTSNSLQSIASRYNPLSLEDIEARYDQANDENRTIVAQNISSKKREAISRSQDRVDNILNTLVNRNDIDERDQKEILKRINVRPFSHFKSNLDLVGEASDELIDISGVVQKPIHVINETQRRQKSMVQPRSDPVRDHSFDIESQRRRDDYGPSTLSNSYSTYSDIKSSNVGEDVVDSIFQKNNLNQNVTNQGPIQPVTQHVNSRNISTETSKSITSVFSDLVRYLISFFLQLWRNGIPVLSRFFSKIQFINPYMRSQFRNQQADPSLRTFVSYKNHGVYQYPNRAAANQTVARSISYEQVTP